MDKTNVDTEITLSANSSTAANLCDQCCQDERGEHRDYCHLINLIKQKHRVRFRTKEKSCYLYYLTFKHFYDILYSILFLAFCLMSTTNENHSQYFSILQEVRHESFPP